MFGFQAALPVVVHSLYVFSEHQTSIDSYLLKIFFYFTQPLSGEMTPAEGNREKSDKLVCALRLRHNELTRNRIPGF